MLAKTLFYSRLIILSIEKNKSVNEIERDLGYPRNSLHKYRYGNDLSGTLLLELSRYFNVSPQYLIGSSDYKGLYNVQEFFSRLNERQKKEVLYLSQEWALTEINKLHGRL